MRRLLPLCLLLASCGPGLGSSGPLRELEELVPGTRVHLMPRQELPVSPAVPSNAQLTYYGGHLIPNVKVYVVFWGSNVRSDIQTGIGNFYATVTNSPYLDWLAEYDTGMSGGTNQFIGRGVHAGDITIQPSNTATTLTDAQIQTELNQQISAGKLPGPDENTILMTYFPPGISISQGNTQSCVAGGFCAYHGTFQRNGTDVFYGVMPDNSPGSGCDTGCGPGTAFQNLSMGSAHELAEAITDAEVGLATTTAAPLAWYDSTNGEIGDICANATGSEVSITGENGSTATVQTLWSNAANGCVATRNASTDFAVKLGSLSSSVSAGGATTVTVQTEVTAGAAGSLNLSASILPAGVTASFNPAAVIAGQSSTLTLSASTTAKIQKNATFAVRADGATTHTAGGLLDITPPPANDFSLTASPPQLVLPAGTSIPISVTTARVSGTAETISLSVSGLPFGVTAQISPTSITAGGSATVTLSATPTAQQGAASVVVLAQAPSVTHSASLPLQVTPPPPVTFESPSDGATVAGQVPISVAAPPGIPLKTLEVDLDTTALGVVTTMTFNQSWDTTQVPNGSHTLTATATDTSGNTSAASITVNVNNQVIASITSPAANSTLVGVAPVTASASVVAGDTLTKVEIYLDGTLVGSGTSAPLTVQVDTSTFDATSHLLSAKAYDSNGNSVTSAAVPILIAPNTHVTKLTSSGCGCTSGGSGPASAWIAICLGLIVFRLRRVPGGPHHGGRVRKWSLTPFP